MWFSSFQPLPVPFLKRFYLFIFREREREGVKHRCERETSLGCLLYVPWPAIKCTTSAYALTGNGTATPCSGWQLNLSLLLFPSCITSTISEFWHPNLIIRDSYSPCINCHHPLCPPIMGACYSFSRALTNPIAVLQLVYSTSFLVSSRHDMSLNSKWLQGGKILCPSSPHSLGKLIELGQDIHAALLDTKWLVEIAHTSGNFIGNIS